MTQYSTNSDLSTDIATTQATAEDTDGDESNITGYTVAPLRNFWDTYTWTITTGGDEGGKYCLIDNSVGGYRHSILKKDEVPTIATGDEVDVLYRVLLPATLGAAYSLGHFCTDDSNGYGLRTETNGDLKLFYVQGTNWWTQVGSTVSKGLSGNTWYWVRVHRMGSGDGHDWSLKVWSGAFSSEPGSWDIGDGGTGGVADTNVVSFDTGIGVLHDSHTLQIDWFSVGTAGDDAPGPAGGSTGGAAYFQLLNRRQ